MADPWGPGVKRDIESVDNYVKSWAAQDTWDWQISALRNKQGPIYIQEQLQIILNAMDSLGGLHNIVNTSGEVTEANSANIETYTGFIRAFKDACNASGGSSPAAYAAFAPIQVIQAGGAVPDTSVHAAVASKKLDLDFYLSFYSAAGGTFTIALEEDHAGTPSALYPDWGAVALVLPAGVTIIGPLGAMNVTNNKDIGFDGSQCSWPANDDSVTIWGEWRAI